MLLLAKAKYNSFCWSIWWPKDPMTSTFSGADIWQFFERKVLCLIPAEWTPRYSIGCHMLPFVNYSQNELSIHGFLNAYRITQWLQVTGAKLCNISWWTIVRKILPLSRCSIVSSFCPNCIYFCKKKNKLVRFLNCRPDNQKTSTFNGADIFHFTATKLKCVWPQRCSNVTWSLFFA